MIINHQYKFIFIKTRKTAGTSIEIALSKFCNEESIITPIGDLDEALRTELGYTGPRNYKIPKNEFSIKNWISYFLMGRKEPSRYYNHIEASKVKQRIGQDIWNEYFTFCFERNPYDKIISRYYFRTRSGRTNEKSFADFIKEEGHTSSDFHKYSENGKVMVDKVYKYDELETSLNDIQQRLGLPEPLSLKNIHAKKQYRQNRKHYSEVFTPELKALVDQFFL